MIDPRAAAAGLPPNPHGDGLATVSVIVCVIAGVLVLCRMLTRVYMVSSVGWDDYTLVISMLFAVGMTVCFQKEVFYGMGLHTTAWLWSAQLLYKFANATTKISIALLYLRIFPSRRFRNTVCMFIAFVVSYCSAAIFTSIFQPIEKAWKKSMEGHCIDIGIVWYVNSAMTLTADAILIILPITNIIRLQLPKAQRVALLFVFSLGIFVMACTIVRCVALGPTVSQKDVMYYQAGSNSWTFLEVDVSVICASLPILRAPLNKIFPRILGNISTWGGSESARARSDAKSSGRAHGTSAISMQNGSGWRKSGQTYAREVRDVSGDDAASDEEQILGPHGIRKTTEVRLNYDEVDAAASRTFVG
ncbi:hypothetical protein LTR36_008825 [Oleoguttula mirabilis]|uniref:Rhodopsin domain-containing protein n=1 Tax=Oleoguttula mirabilis TaxID=1507867 RepID=A0AAV9J7C7_9PEZI|nr:hypothetical protein LTR36_008825 [Oleoguttula mirabilis]